MNYFPDNFFSIQELLGVVAVSWTFKKAGIERKSDFKNLGRKKLLRLESKLPRFRPNSKSFVTEEKEVAKNKNCQESFSSQSFIKL